MSVNDFFLQAFNAVYIYLQYILNLFSISNLFNVPRRNELSAIR